MTVKELIEKLQELDPNKEINLLKLWLYEKIEIKSQQGVS